jgi:hypothetical protein
MLRKAQFRPPVAVVLSSGSLIGYLMGGVFATFVGVFLARMPLQVYDSLSLIVSAQQSPSLWSTITLSLNSYGYLRPAFHAQVKLLFDVAHGHYWLAYRGFHIFLVVAFFALFVRALAVRDRRDLLPLGLALMVFMGIHTFLGAVKELYPITHYLEIAVFCLAALNLVQSKGGLVVDGAIAIVFVIAALTLESGLLVWVVVASAWIAGFRGASTRSVTVVTLLLVGYVVFRFGYAQTGLPSMTERSSGYLLRAVEAPELNARFGENPWPFYVYNVASSAASVLLSQPRSGVWFIARQWLNGDVPPRTWISLASSLYATGLIGWFVVNALTRRRRREREFSFAERQVFVCAAVVLANAVLCYAYTKDEILVPAGAFYAIAVYHAARHLILSLEERPRSAWAEVLVAVIVLVGSSAWAIRAAGVQHVLRTQAFNHRNDWARLPARWDEEQLKPATPEGLALAEQLRNEALATPVVNPQFVPRWAERIFEAEY